MSYALQRLPISGKPGLAAIFPGATLELVEIPFGPLSDVWGEARRMKTSEAQFVLASALHVDGRAIGYAGLRELPGRLFKELAELALEAMALHGMGMKAAGPEDDDEDDAPPVARAGVNGAATEETLAGESRTRPQ
jgi:hypothetical protein